MSLVQAEKVQLRSQKRFKLTPLQAGEKAVCRTPHGVDALDQDVAKLVADYRRQAATLAQPSHEVDEQEVHILGDTSFALRRKVCARPLLAGFPGPMKHNRPLVTSGIRGVVNTQPQQETIRFV
jgi:hypothetical protein